jgi:hypothetical protein
MALLKHFQRNGLAAIKKSNLFLCRRLACLPFPILEALGSIVDNVALQKYCVVLSFQCNVPQRALSTQLKFKDVNIWSLKIITRYGPSNL